MAQAGRHHVAEGGLSTMELTALAHGRHHRGGLVLDEMLPRVPIDWWAQMAVATVAAGGIVAVFGALLVLGVEMIVGVR